MHNTQYKEGMGYDRSTLRISNHKTNQSTILISVILILTINKSERIINHPWVLPEHVPVLTENLRIDWEWVWVWGIPDFFNWI